MTTKKSEMNLTEALTELQNIVTWFDGQDNVDVEQGLEKVRAPLSLSRTPRLDSPTSKTNSAKSKKKWGP